jgi:acetoin utilization protein AcuC
VTCTLHVAWDDKLTGYDFGPGHPLAPIRIKLTMELVQAFGVLSQEAVTVAAAPPASDAEFQLVYDPRYIAVVKAAGALAAGLDAGTRPDAAALRACGLGTADDPIFSGMHAASALVAGATLAAARAVWAGSALHGASIAGGRPRYAVSYEQAGRIMTVLDSAG